jgi:hypothetical protein
MTRASTAAESFLASSLNACRIAGTLALGYGPILGGAVGDSAGVRLSGRGFRRRRSFGVSDRIASEAHSDDKHGTKRANGGGSSRAHRDAFAYARW